MSGDAAYAVDYSDRYAGKTPVVLAIVLGLSFLLLTVAFRSIVIPIKAILLNLLSVSAAFGVLVLAFQDGWGRSLTGIPPSVIDASNPVMVFAILFGLSMDYHVFIVSRIAEARATGLTSDDAVTLGITETAGTVTSAATIMVCVFSGFFLIRISNIQQFGAGLAVAVAIDAVIIRSLLLPATMRLLGDWNWWMPRWYRTPARPGRPAANHSASR